MNPTDYPKRQTKYLPLLGSFLKQAILPSTTEVMMTQPLHAAIARMQTNPAKSFIECIQQQYNDKFYRGWKQAAQGKFIGRSTGIVLGDRLMGVNPSFYQISSGAFISGTAETLTTHIPIIRARLQVVTETNALESKRTWKAIRASLTPHISKNVITYLTIFHAVQSNYKTLSNSLDLKESDSKALIAGITAATIQPLTATLDTAKTIAASESYKKNSALSLSSIFQKTRDIPVLQHKHIIASRMLTFFIGYSVFFKSMELCKQTELFNSGKGPGKRSDEIVLLQHKSSPH